MKWVKRPGGGLGFLAGEAFEVFFFFFPLRAIGIFDLKEIDVI